MLIEGLKEVESSDVSTFRQRTLTVSERYQERGYGARINVPELRLQGLWLGRIGFEVGDRVTVDYVDGKLVISLLPMEPESVQKAG